MQRRRTFTVMAILLAVLVLGVGYAVVSNVTLDLNGTGNINANFDFTVEYDTTHTVGKSTTATTTTNTTPSETHNVVEGAYTNATTATMTVWLDKDNTSAYAIYKVDNKSTELGAKLSTNVTQISGDSSSYFTEVTAEYFADAACTDPLGNDTVPHEQSVYLKVSVGLAKAPLTDVTGATFSVVTTAEPQEVEL